MYYLEGEKIHKHVSRSHQANPCVQLNSKVREQNVLQRICTLNKSPWILILVTYKATSTNSMPAYLQCLFAPPRVLTTILTTHNATCILFNHLSDSDSDHQLHRLSWECSPSQCSRRSRKVIKYLKPLSFWRDRILDPIHYLCQNRFSDLQLFSVMKLAGNVSSNESILIWSTQNKLVLGMLFPSSIKILF